MLDQSKNILIGIFVVIALTIFMYILIFLHPSVGDEGQTMRVRFSNIDKVNVGTRVLFAGHPVGEVVSIQEVENARDSSHIRNGHVYIYELILQIDSSVEVYATDEVSIRTSGLLGEKSIEITPLPAPEGEKLIRIKNQVLYSSPLGSVEEAITEIQAVVEKISERLDVVKETHLIENIAEIAEDMQVMVADAREGKGTLGQFLANDELYLRLISIMSKGETVMDDINHYGLLFNNDKGWQRLRARRANLMAKLSSPIEFQNFFNDEVNNVSTSLARVNMILNESNSDLCRPIVCCPEFQKVFSELLKRVQALEENIKLYDQQLIDTIDQECREKTCTKCP